MASLDLLPVVQELSLNHEEVLFMWDLRRISKGALRTASQRVVSLIFLQWFAQSRGVGSPECYELPLPSPPPPPIGYVDP